MASLDLLQLQEVSNLSGAHGTWKILFIGKDQQRRTWRLKTDHFMGEIAVCLCIFWGDRFRSLVANGMGKCKKDAFHWWVCVLDIRHPVCSWLSRSQRARLIRLYTALISACYAVSEGGIRSVSSHQHLPNVLPEEVFPQQRNLANDDDPIQIGSYFDGVGSNSKHVYPLVD